MKMSPCIRGLKQFNKGCPEMTYNPNTGLGCPAWQEIDMATKGGQDKIEIRECLDLYTARLLYHNNCLLESNQQALESFRNGMLWKDEKGNIVPKPGHSDIVLYNLLEHIKANTKKAAYIKGEPNEEYLDEN